MEIRSVSGNLLAFLQTDEFEGKPAKAMKQLLAAKVGVSRFRQRFVVEDIEIPDEELFASAQLTVQLVVLHLLTPDPEQTQKMIDASGDNEPFVLEELLTRPLNPNVADEDGRTPLHHAAEMGRVTPARLLLEAGADIDHLNLLGRTPLMVAVCEGHLDIVHLLVKAGAFKDYINDCEMDDETAISCAAGSGSLEIVGFLIEAGASIDGALLNAAREGHLDIVRMLLKAGASIDQTGGTSGSGRTALMAAAGAGHLDIVRLLLDAGASKDFVSDFNETAISCAAGEGWLEIVGFLIEAGASSVARNASWNGTGGPKHSA
eukprot:s2984_g12.t1